MGLEAQRLAEAALASMKCGLPVRMEGNWRPPS